MFLSFLLRRRCCCCCCLRFLGWRSFVTENKTKTRPDLVLPWLMLSSPNNPESRYFFDIVGGQTLKLNREIHLPQISSSVCIGSSEGFLFTIPTCRSPEINAINPLSPEEEGRLSFPSTATLRSVEYCWNYSTLGRNYRSWKNRSGDEVILDQNYFSLYLSKIVLSPSRDMAILLRNGKVDYARICGSSLSSWTPIEAHTTLPNADTTCRLGILNDCIFHNGRLHIANQEGRLAIIDMEDPSAMPLFSSNAPGTINQDKFLTPFRRSLVESPDGKDLFFLTRLLHPSMSDKTFLFEVYKLDMFNGDNYKWNQIGSIGDLAFFIGPNTSVAMSVVDFPCLKPNSIYFTDYYMGNFYILNHENVGDTGVFNLEDGSVQFFNLTNGHEELKWPRPVWFKPAVN